MDKYTIEQFNKLFPDNDTCLEWLRNKLYPQKIYCANCKRLTKFYRIKGRKVYGCDLCGYQLSPTANTIFEHSPTPLRSWFYAIYLMSTTRCGISAKQLQRELGVTYKTAWRMFNQIRRMLGSEIAPLSGEIEIDETYFGSHKPGKRGRGAAGKTPVLGMAERKGNIKAMITSDLKSSTVYPIVKEHVSPESMVYTDEFPVYDKLAKHGYTHKRVHHASKVYVSGNAHTNTIEGFWSLLKGGISGVYKGVSTQHLQAYINEYTFRYNHRLDEASMFETMINKIHTQQC
jgi:transposase